MGKSSLTLHTKWPYVRVRLSEGSDIVLTCPVRSGFGPIGFYRDWPSRPYSILRPKKGVSSLNPIRDATKHPYAL
jgi:hypothetical protein